MNDDVEEKKVAENTHDERKHDDVHHLVPASDRIIERADTLRPTEVENDGTNEREEADCAECPLVLAIERIG